MVLRLPTNNAFYQDRLITLKTVEFTLTHLTTTQKNETN